MAEDIRDTASQESEPHHPASKAVLRTLADNPYYSVAFMLAWFYCLWFEPAMFADTDLLSWNITAPWLFFIGAIAVGLTVISLSLGRRHKRETALRYLSELRWAGFIAAGGMSIGGLLFILLMPITANHPGVSLVIMMITGLCYAMFWIICGEHYARFSLSYSGSSIGGTYAIVGISCLVLCAVLPSPINAFLLALFPWISLITLRRTDKKCKKPDYPRLLPRGIRRTVNKSLVVVGSISLLANAVCYYTLAIIPLSALPYGNATFTYGAAGGAILLGVIAVLDLINSRRFGIFHLFPWMLEFAVFAGMLYLGGDVDHYPLSFVISLALSSAFAMLLIMYSGVLTRKGYVRAGASFAASGACVYGGILLGNAIAVFLETHEYLQPILLIPVTIGLLALLTLSLVPFMRQESKINEQMAPVRKESDLTQMIEEAKVEFGLSKRESEILEHLAQGYSAERIAKELVISVYTVQTHIQHIYTKMNIHRRADLLDYLNKDLTDRSPKR